LHGLRIGIPDFGAAENEKFFSTMVSVAPDTREAVQQALIGAGAELVPVPLDATELYKDDPAFDTLLEAGFRLQLNALLQTLGDRAPIKSLAGVIAFNAVDPINRAPYGQDLLERSEANVMSAADYAAFAEAFVDRYRTLLLSWLNTHHVDAICTYANTFAGIYATAGCPALTVPAGKLTTGAPFGATFMGAPFSEPTLLRIGAAFERAMTQSMTQS
jgi:amidase